MNKPMRQAATDGMRRIPGGTFLMGSDRHYPEEAPAHRVRVAPFEMDETASPTASSPPSSPRPAMSPSPSARSTRRSIPTPRRTSSCPAPSSST